MVAEIETDKSNVDLEEPCRGRSRPDLVGEGDAVPVGAAVTRVVEPGESEPSPPSPPEGQPRDVTADVASPVEPPGTARARPAAGRTGRGQTGRARPTGRGRTGRGRARDGHARQLRAPCLGRRPTGAASDRLSGAEATAGKRLEAEADASPRWQPRAAPPRRRESAATTLAREATATPLETRGRARHPGTRGRGDRRRRRPRSHLRPVSGRHRRAGGPILVEIPHFAVQREIEGG